MSFDPAEFAEQMRRALAGDSTDTKASTPMPTPAPAPEPDAPETKCDAGPYRWQMIPSRDRDGYITAVDVRPIERISL